MCETKHCASFFSVATATSSFAQPSVGSFLGVFPLHLLHFLCSLSISLTSSVPEPDDNRAETIPNTYCEYLPIPVCCLVTALNLRKRPGLLHYLVFRQFPGFERVNCSLVWLTTQASRNCLRQIEVASSTGDELLFPFLSPQPPFSSILILRLDCTFLLLFKMS